MALHSLRLLARVGAPPRDARGAAGLPRKLQGLIRKYLESRAALRVALPLPPMTRQGTAAVRPPALRRALPAAWQFRSVAHVIARHRVAQVGVTPVLRLSDGGDEVTLRPAAAERFPGKDLIRAGSRFELRQALQRARRTADQQLGLKGRSKAVGLYLHRDTPMAQVTAWVRRLHEAGAAAVELLFGDGHQVDRAVVALPRAKGARAATRGSPRSRAAIPAIPAADPRPGETLDTWLRRHVQQAPPQRPLRVRF
jgi:hypothetical protein